MINILSNKKGETLIESLTAIMVCVFSIMLLTSLIINAQRINKRAIDANKTFSTNFSKCEQHSLSILEPAIKQLTITSKDEYGTPQNTIYDINVFKSDNGLSSYVSKD